MKNTYGFTLIETVVVIVIMGFAMITMRVFLAPQFERSANPSFQTRATALGQSVMTTILARGYDHNSDFNGGALRCGEGAAATSAHATCTTTFGPDGPPEIISGAVDPTQFNDVDDYQGCWNPGGTIFGGQACGDLNALVGDAVTTYNDFQLQIDVTAQNVNLNGVSGGNTLIPVKRVVLTITAGTARDPTTIVLQASKGNF